MKDFGDKFFIFMQNELTKSSIYSLHANLSANKDNNDISLFHNTNTTYTT